MSVIPSTEWLFHWFVGLEQAIEWSRWFVECNIECSAILCFGCYWNALSTKWKKNFFNQPDPMPSWSMQLLWRILRNKPCLSPLFFGINISMFFPLLKLGREMSICVCTVSSLYLYMFCFAETGDPVCCSRFVLLPVVVAVCCFLFSDCMLQVTYSWRVVIFAWIFAHRSVHISKEANSNHLSKLLRNANNQCQFP